MPLLCLSLFSLSRTHIAHGIRLLPLCCIPYYPVVQYADTLSVKKMQVDVQRQFFPKSLMQSFGDATGMRVYNLIPINILGYRVHICNVKEVVCSLLTWDYPFV
jgi:hypothetical protein